MANMMEKYKALFNNVTDSIFIIDYTGKIISTNNTAYTEYGYTKEEFLELNINDINAASDKAYTNDRLYRIAELGSLMFEAKHQRKDKSELYSSVNCHKATYEGNDVLFSTCRNITDHKLAELKIEKQNEELKKLNSEKDNFFSLIAHDLRNPLYAVLTLSDLIEKSLETKNYDEVGIYVGMISQSTKNVTNLLAELFEWAIASSGHIAFTPAEFDFTALILQIYADHAAIFKQKGIVFSHDLPEQSTIVGDGKIIGKVLRNLISNALKFTDTGGVIAVSAMPSENELTIKVSDTGVGIPEMSIPNLFNLNSKYSTKGTRKEQGTGMGLKLCHELIKKHGGRIWAESTIGIGTVFSFKIPIHNS